MTTIVSWFGWDILRLDFVISLPCQVWRVHFKTRKVLSAIMGVLTLVYMNSLGGIPVAMRKTNASLRFVDQVPKWGKQPTGSCFFFLPLPHGGPPLTWVDSTKGLVVMMIALRNMVTAKRETECLWNEDIITWKMGTFRENESMHVRKVGRQETRSTLGHLLPWSLTVFPHELCKCPLLSPALSMYSLELQVTHWWLCDPTGVPGN